MTELLAIPLGAPLASSPPTAGLTTLLDTVSTIAPRAPADPFAALMASALIDPAAPMATIAAAPPIIKPAATVLTPAAIAVAMPSAEAFVGDPIEGDAPTDRREPAPTDGDDMPPIAIDPVLSPMLAMLTALAPRPDPAPPAPHVPAAAPHAPAAAPRIQPSPIAAPSPTAATPSPIAAPAAPVAPAPIATAPRVTEAAPPTEAKRAASIVDRAVRTIDTEVAPDAPSPTPIKIDAAATAPLPKARGQALTASAPIEPMPPQAVVLPDAPAASAPVIAEQAAPIVAAEIAPADEPVPAVPIKARAPIGDAGTPLPSPVGRAAPRTTASSAPRPIEPHPIEPRRSPRSAAERPIENALAAPASLTPAAKNDAVAPATAPAGGADPLVRAQLAIADDGRWLDTLARDIARSANGDHLQFKLEPVNLGALTISIAQGSDGAAVRMIADTPAARDMLVDAQPALIAEARMHGLRISETRVDLSGTGRQGDSPANPQSNGQQTAGQATAGQATAGQATAGQATADQAAASQSSGQQAARQDANPRRQPDLPDRPLPPRRSAETTAPERDGGERFA